MNNINPISTPPFASAEEVSLNKRGIKKPTVPTPERFNRELAFDNSMSDLAQPEAVETEQQFYEPQVTNSFKKINYNIPSLVDNSTAESNQQNTIAGMDNTVATNNPVNGFAMGGPIDPKKAKPKDERDDAITKKDNIPSYNKSKIGIDEEKNFTLGYIDSPKFRERLEKSGYKDIQKEIDIRYNNVERTKTIRSTDPKISSQYDRNSKTIIMNPEVDNKMSKSFSSSKEIRSHEFGHAETELDHPIKSDNPFWDRTRLNKRDEQELLMRQRKSGSDDILSEQDLHDLKPNENKADLNSLRFLLKKAKIYDAGTQDFKEEHLNKLPKSFVKERLLKNYSKENLIWLMNNVASINKPIENNMAAFGGQMEGNVGDELNTFNVGGRHEENPYGGIPQGTGANGKMNTVEQGETSFDINGQKFIFSNRIKI